MLLIYWAGYKNNITKQIKNGKTESYSHHIKYCSLQNVTLAVQLQLRFELHILFQYCINFVCYRLFF